jgi:hypothetical protein
MRNVFWFMIGILIVTALAAVSAHAGVKNEQGQLQSQSVGVGVSDNNANANHNVATGGNATGGAANAMGGAGGQGGSGGSSIAGVSKSGNSNVTTSNTNLTASDSSSQSQGGNASSGGNVQSTSDVVERSAPSVGLGVIAPNGCGAGVQGGGSGTGGAGMLGFAWTTSECYAFILAQAYNAVGDRKTACLVLNTTNAARRAAKRGLVLPNCEPIKVSYNVVTPSTYTQEQVNAIVKKAVAK